jgi:hypothetical protein
MKCYGSFLVRCWLAEGDPRGARAVWQVEHIQTGALTRAASLSEVEVWALERCRAARAGAGETRGEEDEPGGGRPDAPTRTTDH